MDDVFAWIIIIGLMFVAGVKAEEVRMSAYFPEFVDDPSDIRWAHAVNSREALRMAVEGDVHMIEADVSLGTIADGRGDEGPVMGHPPRTKGVEVDLRGWLGELIALKKAVSNRQRQTRRLGVKLDFKSFDIVMSAFQIVTDFFDEIDFPIWFNADILSGPVNATQEPVTSFLFLHVCNAYFPDSIASVGWTTSLGSNGDSSKKSTTKNIAEYRYDWNHVTSMAALLHKVNTSQSRTFPVRAAFVGRSIDQLGWLLDVVPESTLTVWSSLEDPRQGLVDDLMLLRDALPKSKVYYDLPKDVNEEFRSVKDGERRHAKGDAAMALSQTSVSECILQSRFTLAFVKPCDNAVDVSTWPSSPGGAIRGTIQFLKAPEGRRPRTGGNGAGGDDGGGDDDGQSLVFGVAGHRVLVERSGLIHEVRDSSIVNTTRLARSRCYAFHLDVGHSPASLVQVHVWSIDCTNEDDPPCPLVDANQEGVFFTSLGNEGASAGLMTDDVGGLLVLNVESRGDRYKLMRSFVGDRDRCYGFGDQNDGKLQIGPTESTATMNLSAIAIAIVFCVLMLGPLWFVDH